MTKKAKNISVEDENVVVEAENPAESAAENEAQTAGDESQAKLAAAEALAEEYKGMAQRVQAEFDNFRKRNAESVRIAREEGGNDAVLAFLPVLDTVEIALKMVTDEKALEGLKLIQKKAEAVLDKFGVKEIESADKPFDPAYHNAVMQVEDPENSGKVTEVLQKGYTRGGKVIRYAMVKVAQ